ncbi:MAG: 2-oxoacid:ferredoxin oxidoreductase subunit beta [Gemmatimonadetes bacterium]|nr:2-oxoacid:ferredoxin oxidoreductase subunit beta [Gemmatimonadota bacterium]
MTHIAKPRVLHPGLEKNELGLTRRDYEGSMSTLCAGCGHDSVTAALIEAVWELAIPPHRAGKMSGIGCSSKTPAYFLSESHGFNSVHGRMPSVAAGANAANRGLTYIGVSGDGDSLSIGLGQMCHAIRRNLDLLYIIENNGVYGLTKGQFSASADRGSKSKRGVPNEQPPIDPVLLALSIGASFVARSFSGDRDQLVPILKAGIRHPGLALVDVISPCVTFNDHVGSTKSYAYTREHFREASEAAFVAPKDFVAEADEITAELEPGDVRDVRMHDGSAIRFRRVGEDYDPTDRDRAYDYVRERQLAEEVVTGLLFIDPDSRDQHDVLGTVEQPLWEIPFEDLCPGAAALSSIMDNYR